MILRCWSFVSLLFRQSVGIYFQYKNRKGDLQPIPDEILGNIPDDILVNILSRLPAESVIQCRRVCKRWRNLTATPHFVDLQFKTAKPSVVALYRSDSSKPFWFSTNESTKKLTVTPICRYLMYLMDEKRLFGPMILSSYRGLILYTAANCSDYFICNPFTHENVTLPNPENETVCGFFFHPLTMEHRVVYFFDEDDHYGYKIFSLETSSWRDLSCTSYNKPFSIQPAIVNESLHWLTVESPDISKRSRMEGNLCANLILRFNMNSEVLDTVPHPECENCSGENHLMELLGVEGELCLFQLQRMRWPAVIETWVLTDPAKKHWVLRYKINLEGYVKSYPLARERNWAANYHIRILRMCNHELLLHWHARGLFSHDLRLYWIRKIEIEGEYGKAERYSSNTHETECRSIFVYEKSLVSLRPRLEVLKGKRVEGREWKWVGGEKSCLSVFRGFGAGNYLFACVLLLLLTEQLTYFCYWFYVSRS